MEDGYFVKVPNQYIKGEEKFNDYELLTYLLCKRNFLATDTYVFNLLELTRLINKLDKKKYKDDMKHFKDSLNNFQEWNLFQFYKDKNLTEQIDTKNADNNYLIYALEMESVDGDFTIIKDEDIDYIIKNIGETKISLYGVCHYFAYLTSFIYDNSTSQQFGYCTQNKTLNDIGLCKESKIKYELYLEQIRLMKFEVLGSVKKDGEYKTSKTYYCRYEEESVKQLVFEVQKLIKEKELIVLDADKKKRINEKRQNTQNINYLKAKDDKTEVEIEKLNKLLKRNNELAEVDNAEKEKVKPKEDKKIKRGFINGRKPSNSNDNNDEYWGKPTPSIITEKIKSIAKEIVAVGGTKEEVIKEINERNINSQSINELNAIKDDLQKLLDSYLDLPY